MYIFSIRALHPFIVALTIFFVAACDQSSSTDKNWQLTGFDPISQTPYTIRKSDAAHKLIIINYWAEWCKPCINEIPELNRFASANQNKIIMLGVNFDNKQGASLQEAMRKVGMAFPAITNNPAKVFTLPEIGGLPTTLILDEHGVLREQLPGPQTLGSLETAISKP